eukprot:1157876-Pelagomonas_calceolata.AAC.3
MRPLHCTMQAVAYSWFILAWLKVWACRKQPDLVQCGAAVCVTSKGHTSDGQVSAVSRLRAGLGEQRRNWDTTVFGSGTPWCSRGVEG